MSRRATVHSEGRARITKCIYALHLIGRTICTESTAMLFQITNPTSRSTDNKAAVILVGWTIVRATSTVLHKTTILPFEYGSTNESLLLKIRNTIVINTTAVIRKITVSINRCITNNIVGLPALLSTNTRLANMLNFTRKRGSIAGCSLRKIDS